MPAKAGEQIGAALNSLEEVDRAHRAAGSTRNAVLDREEKRRYMVAVDDTACHDALHALVPALSPHDHHAAAGIGALNALERLVGKGRLDGPPFLVDLFELGCEAPGLDGIAREQQVERERGVGHAPGGVKARYERKRERVGGDRGEVRLAHAGERHIPRARGVAHLVDARGHERGGSAGVSAIMSETVPSAATSSRPCQRSGRPKRPPST